MASDGGLSKAAVLFADISGSTQLYVQHGDTTARTMIAKAIISEGKVQKVSYIPCYANEKREPEVLQKQDPRFKEVVDYVEEISRHEELNTEFVQEGTEVVVRLQ